MLSFFYNYESLINLILVPSIFLITKLWADTGKKNEILAVSVFIIFLTICFNILINGISKGF